MGLVKDEYAVLAPQASYLLDEVVLALAWKKAHAYVRRHNWYSDSLELDCSVVDLESTVKDWVNELATGRFRPKPARLVPAPKNARWVFHSSLPGGWAPVEADDVMSGQQEIQSARLTLRPLAHLGVREQTVATAVMLCLADCVESAQGDPKTDLAKASANGVHSYGNRLFCRWTDDGRVGSFSWGSADSYSRYFQDYQQFVKRPRQAAEALDRSLAGRERRVYIVKLDLSAFFDCIDVERLVDGLRLEYRSFRAGNMGRPADDEEFWQLAKQALSFSWSSEDATLAGLLKGGQLPSGLPQGLMPSGFFANAYLLPFDRAMGSACADGNVLPSDGMALVAHDYCRYVDDLRLVVSVDEQVSEDVLSRAVTRWVQKVLDESLDVTAEGQSGRLTLNGKKTEVDLVSRVAGATSLGARMKQLQQQLSGPFDLTSLEQVETGLNGLLSMAEASLTAGLHAVHGDVPALATVAKPPLEVRDDTLTRFAAYRLCKSLKQRRLLMDLTEEREGRAAGEVLLQDFELAARRLVGAWAENPALIQVLRYAFDLFPGPELLRDVLDAIDRKLTQGAEHPDQAYVAWYVVAELYRAAATETGRRSTRDPGFLVGDVGEYRQLLSAHAMNILRSGQSPWFVQQQAALLLASVNVPTIHLSQIPELSRYRALHAYLNGEVSRESGSDGESVVTAMVGYQLAGDAKAFDRWFMLFAIQAGLTAARKGFHLIYLGCRELFLKLTSDDGMDSTSIGLLSGDLLGHVDARNDAPAPLPLNTWLPLARAIAHPSRVFQQENGLLKLGLALVALGSDCWRTARSQFDFQVRCADWWALDNPTAGSIEVRLVPNRAPVVDAFGMPQWCSVELGWMYSVGQLLRAAALGDSDFTFNARLGFGEEGWYRGILSSVTKRRIGMAHSSQALGGTTSAITPWFSGLLSGMLRWPGVNLEEDVVEGIRSIVDLRQLLEARLAQQAEIFGKSSNSPIYRYPVAWEPRQNRILRVATVQGLLPRAADFVAPGLDGMNTSPYRAKHRNHTAALLKLAARKIGAHASVHGRRNKPEVDLVVLPEYSVHVDDQDLLRAFADETGAMLHYGLLGAVCPNSGSPTNVARWLIPVRTRSRRSWIEVDQGKLHLTAEEHALGIATWCPYRVVIELQRPNEAGFRMAGAICYDATDLALAADLKNETHMFVVPAMNRDVKTFDSMVASLRYHMYQHVVISNAGEFGGSTAQAPYDKEHLRVISHSHGLNQIAVSVFEVSMDDFGPPLLAASLQKPRIGKTPPAALRRRP